MKDWQTTVGGILTSAGISLQLIEDNTVKIIGIGLSALGALLIGVFATQRNKQANKKDGKGEGAVLPDKGL